MRFFAVLGAPYHRHLGGAQSPRGSNFRFGCSMIREIPATGVVFGPAPVGETGKQRITMRGLAAGIFLALAASLPAQQAAAQDPLAGAIVGGAVGGIIGGAVGRGAGAAVAGAVIGAAAGATIAAEAQQRAGGYYWWRGGCYYRYPNGSWLQVQPGYCS